MKTHQKFIFLLIIIGFFVYFPSFFGNFIWDDEDFLYANSYVKNFQVDKFFTSCATCGRGKISSYYRPIQLFIYSLFYQLFGAYPFFYHFLVVIFHLLVAVTLFIFLTNLLKKEKLSFLTALFFLIHPLQTEAVSYIAGLPDPLFVFFMFLSLYFYINPQKKYASFFTLFFFVLSFLSKETGLLTVFYFLLIKIFFKKGKQEIIFLAFLIGLFFYLLRITVFNFLEIKSLWGESLYAKSVFVRFATFFQNFFLYLSLIIFPKDLFMERDYSIKIPTSFLNLWTVGFFGLNFLILAAIYFFKNKEERKLFFFAWFGFLFSLAPYSGIVLINGIFYEHFLYLGLSFFFLFVLSFFSKFFQKKAFFIILSIVVLLLIARSYLRQWEWIDNERFYRQTLSFAPKSLRVINNLGMALSEKGKIDEAIAVYKRGITIDDKNPNLYHNLANAFLQKGEDEKAEKNYLKAIEVDPNFIFSYYSLINFYLKKEEKEKLREFLKQKALITFPNSQDFLTVYERIKSD